MRLLAHSQQRSPRSKQGKPTKSPDALGKLFIQLGTKGSEKILAQLIAIGMPAVERLVEGGGQGRPVCMPAGGGDQRCFLDAISEILYKVARAHRKEFAAYALARREHGRVNALVGYLGATRDPRVLPLLIEASRDKDSCVRGDAVRALKDLGDVRAVPALLARIEDRDGLVADAAMGALGSCGDKQALAVLEKLARKGKDLGKRGTAAGSADAIRRRLGLPAVPRKPGRTMTVALDESHLTARQRVGRSFRVHVKVGDLVVEDQRLASVVDKNGACDLEAPFAGEVVEVASTKDRVSVTVRQRVGA
jgi:hypothetical protein